MSAKNDVFAKAPEFLAAFKNVRNKGFFEEVHLHVGGRMMEGKIHTCLITAAGYVPANKRYKESGCGAVVDPDAIVASCRKLALQKTIKGVSAEVKTENWKLWDARETEVVGSKGVRVVMSMLVVFEV